MVDYRKSLIAKFVPGKGFKNRRSDQQVLQTSKLGGSWVSEEELNVGVHHNFRNSLWQKANIESLHKHNSPALKYMHNIL